MATRHDSEPAPGETEVLAREEIGSQALGPEEITQAGEDWPVAREYRISPENGNAAIAQSGAEAGEMVVAAPPRSRRLPLYVGTGLLAALLAVLLLIGAAWLLSGGDESSGSRQTAPAPPSAATKPKKAAPAAVAVPDVTSLEVNRARAALEDAGFRVEIRQTASAPATAAPGSVLRQTPASGTDVASGTVVVLTVSGAQPRIQVPTVIGLMASDATQAVQDAGLSAKMRLVRSAKPAGTVLDQSPSPGTELAADSVVRLEVAKASPPVTIAVPRLVGSTAAQAKSRLRSDGLRWTVTRVESPKPAGTVVGQSPNAGARLRKGQTVTLEISTGPAQVTIPDVMGLDEQSARAELEAAGFTVQVTDEPTSDASQDGLVISQAPAGGSNGEKAGVVTLTVARFS